jgi:endogenous inhibitor of DNA gyrase (YacG/DUF329 family)
VTRIGSIERTCAACGRRFLPGGSRGQWPACSKRCAEVLAARKAVLTKADLDRGQLTLFEATK